MKYLRAVTWLTLLIAMLVIIVTSIGLFSRGGPGPHVFTTLRGTAATIYGVGLYQSDTLLIGSGFRGNDAVSLFIGVPVLLLALWLRHRGSARGELLLLGALGYFLYVYTSMVFGAAYNSLFILYLVIFSASLFAFTAATVDVDLTVLAVRLKPAFPARAVTIFMFVIAAVLVIVWFGLSWLPSTLAGNGAALVESYTTVITYVLDLGVIAPFAALAGWLLLRRKLSGPLFSMVLLHSSWLIGTAIAGNTVAQVQAGYPYTPGQIVGLVAPFVLMTLVGGWLAVRCWRAVDESPMALQSGPAMRK